MQELPFFRNLLFLFKNKFFHVIRFKFLWMCHYFLN